ncbi:hypothetical protein PCCS19_18370 [Paenibacillus sp. CCS19]|uniref:DUF3221 domain-containing protein n=1 Tax=Paenibacillus sp. CCS19 TaxID=3158387 RepID=UPI002563529B|nr:DUF3221 domain-containing protein [Paenibacillus cellulosilyticus]GMK38783.1 hypothetical protein PCCS19_18370 [Paenibacillus cellulosilyticus]
MQKSMIGLSILCMLVFLVVGCGEGKESSSSTESTVNSDFTGYVTKIEKQRALIVTPISRQINESNKEFYDAIWVSNMPPNIKIGQHVEVWFNGGIETSYPGQGMATKVTMSEIRKPATATLTQDEVIRKALLDQKIANINILVIKEVTYDEQTTMWTIRYKNAAFTDDELEEYRVQIPDQ